MFSYIFGVGITIILISSIYNLLPNNNNKKLYELETTNILKTSKISPFTD